MRKVICSVMLVVFFMAASGISFGEETGEAKDPMKSMHRMMMKKMMGKEIVAKKMIEKGGMEKDSMKESMRPDTSEKASGHVSHH